MPLAIVTLGRRRLTSRKGHCTVYRGPCAIQKWLSPTGSFRNAPGRLFVIREQCNGGLLNTPRQL
jgi:hypothetical protein